MAKLPNIDLVNEMIEKKNINIQRHPTADIWIYNYSNICQIYHEWNAATCFCRGVICDSDYNIIARPFGKFFNYEEITDTSEIPVHLPFEVFEKLDGSLGIMYWIDNIPYISTRGSFISDQALHATEILHKNYSQYFDKLDETKTYLFEIIYPEDKHCVSYGDIDDIFLIAVIDNETGNEYNIDDYNNIFNVVKRYDGVKDFKKVREMFNGNNREGFVIKFSNNYRIKMKYEEYFKLSFIMNHLSEKVIIDSLINDNLQEVVDMINKLSEENKIYYNQIINKINKRYNEIESEVKSLYKEFDTDKEAAEYFLQFNKPYSGILFSMRKDRDYSNTIWRIIRNECKKVN